jgi:MFS family permease
MQTETAVTASATEPMNRTPVVALVAASAISQVGSMLTLIALPWFVLVTTGSPAKTGLTAFFEALPGFIAGVFGGTLVDRLGYKRAGIIADVVSGCGVALVPALYHTVGLAFWQFLAFVFLGSLLKVPGLTARRSLLPELARLGGLRLEQANASYEAINSVSALLGPPLAGVLIAWLGASNVLWVDAATFALSALVVAAAIPGSPAGAEPAARGRYLDELLKGLRFLRADRVLLALAVTVAIANFLTEPIFAVALPVYVKEAFGRATVLGLLAAAWGAGALAGTILYGALGHRLSRRALWLGAWAVASLTLWALVVMPSLPLLVAALVVGGVAGGPINPLMVTVRHERIPPSLRGRVFSTFSAITLAASPLGMVAIGNAIEGLGLRPALFALVACNQLLSAAMFFVPAFRDLDVPARPNDEPDPEGAA